MRLTRVTVWLGVLVVILASTVVGWVTLKRLAYEGFGRDRWQQPEKVIECLGITGGSRTADLGCGGGYFTFRLAQAVGSSGRVYAVDVDADMTEYVSKEAVRRGHRNVETILGRYDDPLLPVSGVDLIFTANTYHHIEHRAVYFRNVQKYLRPGGRVAIIEFNGKGWFERLFGHWVKREVIISEMQEAGYRLAGDFDFLDRQHFLIFDTGK
jgi:ubiquinone/menaquinone biosynthesis C-methylase UbiE